MKKYIDWIIVLIILSIIGILIYLFVFNNVAIKEIILDKKEIEMNVGSVDKITSTIVPEDASDQDIEWISNNKDVVITTQNGVIRAVGAGEADIVVQTKKGKVKSSCHIKVSVIEVEKIELSTNYIQLGIGNQSKVIAKVLPENASYQNVSYKSSDSSIVTVDEYGNIKALKDGTVEIIVTDIRNQTEAKCKVLVKPKSIDVEKIELDKTGITVELNQTVQLNATIKPDNATNKTVVWESSDPNIATVSNGLVTPKRVGEVVISAKSNDKIATAIIEIISSTRDKTAIFFGDSITYGKYGNYSWANYIGEMYDLKSTVNTGKSGGVISNTRKYKWIEDIVRKYKDNDYDYVIMHGGFNDIYHGTKMGSYKANDFSGNYDTKTFIGGLEHYIYTVKKQWPNAKIGYIVNYATPQATSVAEVSDKYYSKMKEVLKKWGVSYIDLYSGTAPNGKKYSDLLKVNTNTYIPDGVHLSRKGYNLISPYIYDWMSSL